jgi:uncharacterized protein (TIGR03435 family)
MIARFLMPLFAVAAPVAVAQMGMYGPITVHLKAGDLAPDLQFNKQLSGPGNERWSPSNLTGQLTVLIFYLNTSRNLQTITMWNSLVDEFAGKPVQFVFISGEKATTLLPWLSQHPIKGWVFHDPDGRTGEAYGLDRPETVFIGGDGKIIGFGNMGFPPESRDVNAALEGRITTTRPTRATLKTFIESGKVLLNAESQRMPRPDEHKPKIPPSYSLHVSPSQSEDGGNFGGDDFWALQGFTLKDAIDMVYDVNSIRVHLPAAVDDHKPYDFSLVLPQPEDRNQMKVRFQQGIQDYFHLIARREERVVDVYLVTTASNHRVPPAKPRNSEHSFGSSSSIQFETSSGFEESLDWPKPLSIEAIRGLSIDGTVDEFCHRLEAELDRPLINETNLQGEFQFHIEDPKSERNDFLERLRDQLGLVITPAQRNVETLVFDPQYRPQDPPQDPH